MRDKNGQAAFTGRISGSNDLALFAYDDELGLRLVVREGQMFDLDDNPNQSDIQVLDDLRKRLELQS